MATAELLNAANGKSDEAHRKLHALGIKDYTELAITEVVE